LSIVISIHLSLCVIMQRFVVMSISDGDPVGVLGSWPPHVLALWGSKCARTPHILVPCCYLHGL